MTSMKVAIGLTRLEIALKYFIHTGVILFSEVQNNGLKKVK